MTHQNITCYFKRFIDLAKTNSRQKNYMDGWDKTDPWHSIWRPLLNAVDNIRQLDRSVCHTPISTQNESIRRDAIITFHLWMSQQRGPKYSRYIHTHVVDLCVETGIVIPAVNRQKSRWQLPKPRIAQTPKELRMYIKFEKRTEESLDKQSAQF